jgi:predicted PurR-regulated permease PerM
VCDSRQQKGREMSSDLAHWKKTYWKAALSVISLCWLWTVAPFVTLFIVAYVLYAAIFNEER